VKLLSFGWLSLMVSTAAWAQLGEEPAIKEHVDQSAIDAGDVHLDDLIEAGRLLFEARFKRLDGQGRPASTGAGVPRAPDEPAFIRTSGPDSNSCTGCHAQPRPGGAGDFVANVFVLAQTLDPVISSVDAMFSDERNTLGMMGAGPIEMLARELSQELIAIREQATAEAAQTGRPVTRSLTAKGIGFGSITVLPDGKVDPSQIEGVDWDLIVKPFHQKGAVVSLREFTNNAMNHHHGMQSVERFGEGVDADGDSVVDELTVGDITAVTVFQAALNTPGQVITRSFEGAIADGERLFGTIGCAKCHVPTLTLNDRRFTEPNPFHPTGNLHVEDVPQVLSFDLTVDGPKPRLEPSGSGGALVRAFTDLKRHDLNDDEFNHFDNEQIPQGMINGSAPAAEFTIAPFPRPTAQFLTRKLWNVGNTAPYGHRGDLTTLTEAINFHGGEARTSRDAFFTLPQADQDKVIGLVKSLQIAPDGSDLVLFANADGTLETSGTPTPGGTRLCGAIGAVPLMSMGSFLGFLRSSGRRALSRRGER